MPMTKREPVGARGQTSVKNSGRPQDFAFSNPQSPTQDLIALALLNPMVPLKSFPKTISLYSHQVYKGKYYCSPHNFLLPWAMGLVV